MKQIIFLITVIVAFSACSKKNYSCTCTADIDGQVIEISKYNLTPEDAASACSNRDMEEGISCVLAEE